jgi:hypothetical protein
MIAPFGTKRANFGPADKKVGVCNCLCLLAPGLQSRLAGTLTVPRANAHDRPVRDQAREFRSFR